MITQAEKEQVTMYNNATAYIEDNLLYLPTFSGSLVPAPAGMYILMDGNRLTTGKGGVISDTQK